MACSICREDLDLDRTHQLLYRVGQHSQLGNIIDSLLGEDLGTNSVCRQCRRLPGARFFIYTAKSGNLTSLKLYWWSCKFTNSLRLNRLTEQYPYSVRLLASESTTSEFSFLTVAAIMCTCLLLNSLGTALFCCKFNLVDTDQFSCEYPVWFLCYCSQTNVLFSPLGRRTCPYPSCWECPTHSGSEVRNVLQPWHFSLNFDALGWLLTDPNT